MTPQGQGHAHGGGGRIAEAHGRLAMWVATRGSHVRDRSWLAVAVSCAACLLLTAGAALLDGRQQLVGVLTFNNNFLEQFSVRNERWDEWLAWEEHFDTPRELGLLFEGPDVLEPAALRAAQDAERTILAVVTDAGHSLQDVCTTVPTQPRASCLSTSLFPVLGWAGGNASRIPDNSKAVLAGLGAGAAGGAAVLSHTIGVSIYSENTTVTGLASRWFLRSDWPGVEEGIESPTTQWEAAVLEFLDGYTPPLPLTGVRYMASRSFADESFRSVAEDFLYLLPLAVLVMLCYCCIMLGKASPISGGAQYFLATQTVVAPLMAALMAWGAMGYLDRDLNVICLVAPFLCLGVGIDDAYVILSFVERQIIAGPADVAGALVAAMREAGPAIFVTTATDVIAFSVAAAIAIGETVILLTLSLHHH